MVARLGGEEFVVVMPGLESDDVAPVVERMRRAIEALAIVHEGLRGQSGDVVTISLGAAIATGGDMERRRSLLTLADRALYEAKRAGRNCWRLG
jgi:diguanylate cyclase (GGDEF)-like protein